MESWRAIHWGSESVDRRAEKKAAQRARAWVGQRVSWRAAHLVEPSAVEKAADAGEPWVYWTVASTASELVGAWAAVLATWLADWRGKLLVARMVAV
jgi:hypothetical protein